MAEKRFYLVKNITSGETNTPEVNKIDGVLDGQNYSLLKKSVDAPEPTGETVIEYMLDEEFICALSLEIFANKYPGVRPYKLKDKEFCYEVQLHFQSDAGGLDMATSELLVSEFVNGTGLLDAVFIKLESNSPQLAYEKLQLVTPTAYFPQEVKDYYLNMLNQYLQKFPR